MQTGEESGRKRGFYHLQSIGWHRKRSKAMQNDQTDCKQIALYDLPNEAPDRAAFSVLIWPGQP
jgi:hypothetical protein